MDKGWQKNLLAFLGLIAAIMAVATFFRPSEPQASFDIDGRLRAERKAILEFVAVRTSAAENKLDAINDALKDFKTESRENFKKLDDRLYEMQRQQSASNPFATEYDEGS